MPRTVSNAGVPRGQYGRRSSQRDPGVSSTSAQALEHCLSHCRPIPRDSALFAPPPPLRPSVRCTNSFSVMTRDEAAVAAESSDDDVPGLVEDAAPQAADKAAPEGDAGTRRVRPLDSDGLVISGIWVAVNGAVGHMAFGLQYCICAPSLTPCVCLTISPAVYGLAPDILSFLCLYDCSLSCFV